MRRRRIFAPEQKVYDLKMKGRKKNTRQNNKQLAR